MQKTQVIKLNTSKDNVDTFFNKVKDKLHKQGKQIDNYDITMIVKRQTNHSHQQNINDLQNHKQQTLKSIFSQNTPIVNQTNIQKNIRNTIYDEDMHIQNNILQQQQTQKQQKVKKKQITQGSNSSNTARKSNEIPNENTLFQFKKKQKTQKSQNISKHNNNYFPNLQKPPHPKQQAMQQQSDQQSYSKSQNESKSQSQCQSDNSSSSSNSQIEQVQQQQLKRHISHRHIDIFPNIELNNVVSQKLMSMNSLKPVGKKPISTQRRRCSINDENLLSPRMQTIFNQQIKHQSTKDINNLLKDKLSKSNSTIKSQNKFDIDDGIKENDMEQAQVKLTRKQRKSNTSIRAFEDDERHHQLEVLARPQIRSKTKQRTSALAKKSIFQEEQQSDKNPKPSKNKIQFDESNHVNEFIITAPQQPSHTYIDKNNNNTLNIQSDQDQQSQSSTSSNQQPQDSIYTIENKLNDCIDLIQKNQIFKLQDFLYQFKNKYNYVTNTRIQIKWRLMMAHCKESKKQFQRAAINYNHVIQMAKDNPKSLTIEPAQVYHRLGVCYSEIAQYNKGILAFTQALNRYKRAKNPLKYAQCINNLGTLYLQAESLNLAQKCFLQSYHLKKSLNGKNNTKLLTSLFNIFQCNLLMKNYDQAEKIILVIEEQIINNIPEEQTNRLLYMGGLYRRKGKMEFLRGNLKQAEQNYLKAFQSLSNRYPYCMQFGQLMSCMGILKLQDKKYREAKQYYDKAIMLMNFYCPKDSTVIHTLKKNLQYAVKMIAEERQGSTSRNSFFD